jgi:hypothetical protein
MSSSLNRRCVPTNVHGTKRADGFRLESGFTDLENLYRLRDRVQLTRHLLSRLDLRWISPACRQLPWPFSWGEVAVGQIMSNNAHVCQTT